MDETGVAFSQEARKRRIHESAREANCPSPTPPGGAKLTIDRRREEQQTEVGPTDRPVDVALDVNDTL
jgi:hypothetical protein